MIPAAANAAAASGSHSGAKDWACAGRLETRYSIALLNSTAAQRTSAIHGSTLLLSDLLIRNFMIIDPFLAVRVRLGPGCARGNASESSRTSIRPDHAGTVPIASRPPHPPLDLGRLKVRPAESLRYWSYSVRSACTGSTKAARRAGR
jgi:hypothetical protein